MKESSLGLWPSLILVAALPACSSGGNRAAAGPTSPTLEAGAMATDAAVAAADAADSALPAIGPDDVDDDLPLPLAAGIAPTPPMGWNSWNTFSCNVSDQVIERVADTLVASGMKDAGYRYVNIDDCWAQTSRAADGTIQAATNFPNGIQPVADYVHSLGLKLGIYSDRGTQTCAGRAGSQGYEAQDATSYAAWGVDYLKYDNCSATLDIQTQYTAMGTSLGATGRPFVYSLCAWSFYEWGVGVGNLWRTTGDIQPMWDSFFGNLMTTRYLAAYAGPARYIGDLTANGGASTAAGVAYGWNDPDMLEVGNGLTDTENQAHFSLWSITAAPLIAGNDVRSMTAKTQSILTNKEVIALDQDALGLQAFPTALDGSVWAKPLNESGARGVVLVNPNASVATIGFQLTDIGLRPGTATVRDLAAQKDLGALQDGYSVTLPTHGSATLKVSGTEPPRPHGTQFLSDLQWTYAANGLGNVHRDQANTSSQAVTHAPIALRGTTYAKGLGADAPSMIIYRLAKQCSLFRADVGVDDAARGSGSVVFQVWVDGAKLFDSGTVTGTSAPMTVQVPLDGKRRLTLMATNAGDGSSFDRADWGNAQVVCAP